jgi:RTX calcium-binding nonapeptide repeat (4 copies)
MRQGRISRSIMLVFAVGLLWPVLAAAPAAAAPCGDGGETIQLLLRDTDGWLWDLDVDGSVNDGLADAFDGYAEIEVGGADYPSAPDDGCTWEEGGREVVYPEATLAGLEVGRKVFVPSAGAPFARFLTTLRNAGAAPVTTAYTLGGNLGSDSDTFVFATSSGDAAVTPEDRWAVSNDTDGDPTEERVDPAVGTIWDGLASGAAQTATTTAFINGDDTPEFTYDVTVPPGSTFVFLHVVVQRLTDSEGISASTELSAGLSDVFAGMSAQELAALRNWALPVCRGKTATVFGTSGDDSLAGTADDVVLAGDGNDSVVTGGGKDTVCAGGGNDKVNAGGGKDFVLGEAGNDRMNGGPGTDTCKGGPGKDKARACERGKA